MNDEITITEGTTIYELDTDGHLIVAYGEYGSYDFDRSAFRCESCDSGRVRVTYLDEQIQPTVRACSLGTTCKNCGDTSLNIAYRGR
jgi:hypothetical protein